MIGIGVMGTKGNDQVIGLIYEKLNENDKSVSLFSEENDCEEVFLNQKDFAIINIGPKITMNSYLKQLNLKILILTDFGEDLKLYREKISEVVGLVEKGGYIIFDNNLIEGLNIRMENNYPITCGFSGKTTVTASSIDDVDNIKLSFCLQRSITNIKNEFIRPFEKPVSIGHGYEDLVFSMYALTALLISGINI